MAVTISGEFDANVNAAYSDELIVSGPYFRDNS